MIRLGEVMSRRVVTASETRTFKQLAQLMDKEKVGSVVITRGAKIVGIVTERDVIAVLASDEDPGIIQARAVMSKPVVTGPEDGPLEEAVRLMVRRNIKKLPIVRGEALVGMVTFTDFARFGPIIHDTLRAALQGAPPDTKARFAPPGRKPPRMMYH